MARMRPWPVEFTRLSAACRRSVAAAPMMPCRQWSLRHAECLLGLAHMLRTGQQGCRGRRLAASSGPAACL